MRAMDIHCKVEGCGRKAQYRAAQVCQKHYFRMMRNGHYGFKGTREPSAPRPRKSRYSDNRGYVMVRAEGHPLADKRGLVREHRLVYHDQVCANPTACALCVAPINWKTLHIDHEDENPANNAPSNLRALCRGCNVYRAHSPLSMGCNFFEVDGVRMTAAAWARMPGVEVAGNTMMVRRRKGMSDYDAIYSPRRTHQNTHTKKLTMKHDTLRGITADFEARIKHEEARLAGKTQQAA